VPPLGCALARLGLWTPVVSTLVSPAVRSATFVAHAPWCSGLSLEDNRAKEVCDYRLATLGVHVWWVLRDSVDDLTFRKTIGKVVLGFRDGERPGVLAGNRISDSGQYAQLAR
jgi:hypothetical protein